MSVKLHFQILLMLIAVVIIYGAIRLSMTQTVTLPEISFYDKSDQKVTLQDFKGKVVLVNLWASWCLPCMQELPSLEHLQTQLPQDKFKIVAISMDKASADEVALFLKAKGAQDLDVYRDKDLQVPLKWKYDGLPTSFLVNASGVVVKQYNGGYEWDQDPQLKEIRAQIQ